MLAGGVGASRFLEGLRRSLPQARITAIGNTADDFEVHGLHVSPDLDTVTYTLAGLADLERGWGLAGETWSALGQLEQLGAETWFQLGDRDLATHIWRTDQLRHGRTLTQVTARLGARLQLPVELIPMSDQAVTSRVHTTDGRDLHIQEFLVRERCAPKIARIDYLGAARARPAPGVVEALRDAELVLIAPSNPIISIGPILAVPGIRAELQAAAEVAAVSPIVAGSAIKGPAVEMLLAAGVEPSAFGVASLYRDFLGTMVVDNQDRELVPRIEELGLRAFACDTLMVDAAARLGLARQVLAAVELAQLSPLPRGARWSANPVASAASGRASDE